MARKLYEDYYDVALPSDIDVHHVDGNIRNNQIENLMALPHGEHSKIRWKKYHLEKKEQSILV